MSNEIVAKVTEPKREPRPNVYVALHKLHGKNKWDAATFTDKRLRDQMHKGCAWATIPGELEQQRLARIEAARDAVCVHVKKWIEANPYIPNCPDDPELAKARMLVAELTLAEQEPPPRRESANG